MSSSGERCKNRDIIPLEIAGRWSNAFLGAQKRDEYNEPLTAKAAWWEGLKAEEILLVASADECLTDDVAKMGEILKVSHFSSFFLFFSSIPFYGRHILLGWLRLFLFFLFFRVLGLWGLLGAFGGLVKSEGRGGVHTYDNLI